MEHISNSNVVCFCCAMLQLNPNNSFCVCRHHLYSR